MGKDRGNKRRRLEGGRDLQIHTRAADYSADHVPVDTLQLSELENNLNSFEEVKRKQACILLADLYQFNASNGGSLDALASKKVLMKLGMRLMDNSPEVKSAASLALKNLTESGNQVIQTRVLGFGMLRTIMQSVFELAPTMSTHDPSDHFTFQNFLYTVANLLTSSPEASNEIVKSWPGLVNVLVTTLHTVGNGNMSLVNTIANLLCEALKTKCISLFTPDNILAIQQVLALHWTVDGSRFPIVTLTAEMLLSSAELDSWVIKLQLLEVLALYHVRSNSAHNSHTESGMLPLGQVVDMLLTIYDRVLKNPVLLEKDIAPLLATSQQDMEVEESASISTAPSQAASQSTSFTAPAPLTPSDAAWSLLDLVLDTIASLCASLSDGSFTPSLASFLSLPLPLALLQSLSTIRSLLDAHIQDKEGIKFLPHRAMCSLFAVEKVLESVNDVMTASKYALEERHMSTASLHPDTLPVVRGHLTWQLEAVQGVSSVVQQGGGAGEAWRVLDAVGADLDGAQISLKASVFTSAQCSLELLHAALQISCHQSMIGGVSVEEVRDLAGQQVRWLQLPQLELLSCVVSNITTLANVPLPPFFPANLHALLTNALLNKAASPQSFSLESVGKNQADNVARSTLFCLDITVNSVIDLHSSDEPEYLATFSKLKALEKLTSIGQDMLARYETAKQRGILTGEDVEKVEETLENLSNFIEYKQQFVGK